jgi:hypothetical protein
MIQIPVNLAQRILEAARIAAAIHREQSYDTVSEAEGAGRAPRLDRARRGQAERLKEMRTLSN